ncbi:MAG: hypothetical protein ACRD29_23305 [Acidimicrobiales bacterium]
MFLWFVGASMVIVWLVFRSPAVDYRVVALGSALPLLDALTRGLYVLHTLVAPAVILGVVVLATRGRRLAQRRWIGVPIGMFLHLVLDGMWTRTEAFWWPAFGCDLDGRLPELTRGLLLVAAMEVAGLAALVWLARSFHLDDPVNRARFLRTGHLPRDIARGP